MEFNHVYFAYVADDRENGGFYIAAQNRNTVKSIAARNLTCDYVEVHLDSTGRRTLMSGVLATDELIRLGLPTGEEEFHA